MWPLDKPVLCARISNVAGRVARLTQPADEDVFGCFVGQGLPPEAGHGFRGGPLGDGGVQAQAVVALQHAQREGVQGRGLVGHDAPVARHLYSMCCRSVLGDAVIWMMQAP